MIRSSAVLRAPAQSASTSAAAAASSSSSSRAFTPSRPARAAAAQSSPAPRPTTSSSSATPATFFPVQGAPSPSSRGPEVPPPAKPSTKLWFTAAPSLRATLDALRTAAVRTRAHLFHAGVLSSINAPLPSLADSLKAGATASDEASKSLLELIRAQPPTMGRRRWAKKDELQSLLSHGAQLRTSDYRAFTGALSELDALAPLARIAQAIGPIPASSSSRRATPQQLPMMRSFADDSPPAFDADVPLAVQIESLIRPFELRGASSATLGADGSTVDRQRETQGIRRHLGKIDDDGLVYALGRRKESSARVWLAPFDPNAMETDADADAMPVGRVLVNNAPLPFYLPIDAHRSVVLRPFALVSALGAFNVFALAQGGGLAAQADAIAMAAARALTEWERVQVEATHGEAQAADPDLLPWRRILKKAGLLDRDPRMVERKKTGLDKARKAKAWVKR